LGLGIVGCFNTYGYVNGQQTKLIDPSGNFAAAVVPFIPVIITGTDIAIGAGPAALGYGLDLVFNKPPRDAEDANGAKAPGKPSDAEGFCPPKSGKPVWDCSPNARGSGWVDGDGSVWVPTGPKSGSTGDSYGGPH
jgi:hypothetical protein